MRKTLAIAFLAAVLPSVTWSHGPDHGAHPHAAFAAGEPGDARRPARVVQVVMRDGEDGRMSFSPTELTVRRGEHVRFVLRNVGRIEHEFVLDSLAGNAAHKVQMALDPGMKHGHPNEKRIADGQSGEFVWRFTKAGTFEFACLIPGHYEAGMKGTVTVK